MNQKGKIKEVNFIANIGSYQDFGNYLNSYHNAFNILIKKLEKTNTHIDSVVYPTLFLGRHCLELGFKANINYFKTYSNKNDCTNSDSHNLMTLFRCFKTHITATILNLKEKHNIIVDPKEIDEFNYYCNELEKISNQFDILDKGSFSFRYPIDTKNVKVFSSNEKINVLDFKKTFDKSMILLNYTSDVFSKYTDYIDMIKEYFEQEMKSNY